MPYVTTYPTDPYVLNPQDETNDFIGPGDDAVGNAVDYNQLDQEMEAIHNDLLAALVAAGDPADIAAMTAKIVGGYTDGGIWFGARHWDEDEAGTWTKDGDAGGAILKRTPLDGSNSASLSIAMIARVADNRGMRITSVDWVYSISAANAAVDIILTNHLTTLQGDGSAPTIAGAAGGSFDTGHNTAAKRRTIGEHTATWTRSGPLFVANNSAWILIFSANDSGGGTSEINLRGAYVRFESVTIDGA